MAILVMIRIVMIMIITSMTKKEKIKALRSAANQVYPVLGMPKNITLYSHK